MTYTAPYIDETGLHLNTFEDIKNYYVNGAKGIFGDDIYVDDDSMDGQLISIFAKGQYDTQKCLQYAYNNHSPQTSYGVVLSRLVLLSGISRKKSGYSTVYLKLTGEPFTIIHSGIVSDVAGNKWILPTTVNLGENGVVYVTATAEKQGNITALTNTVTQIETPTYGWRAVTNEAPASPATPLETDAELKARQSKSVALPSQGLAEGTQSALLNLDGVTDCIVKENDENINKTIENLTLPPHSITCIVKGGSEADIANTIFYRKNQGCYTNGTTTVIHYDLYNNANSIRFYRPTDVPIKVSITIRPFAGYSSDITDEIKANLISYIDSLNISKDVSVSLLYSIINKSIPDLANPIFAVDSVEIARVGGSFDTDDIEIDLNEEASLTTSNITITLET